MIKESLTIAFLSIFVAFPAFAFPCKVPPHNGEYAIYMRSKKADPICKNAGIPVYTSTAGNFDGYVKHWYWGEWRRVYVFRSTETLSIEQSYVGYGAWLFEEWDSYSDNGVVCRVTPPMFNLKYDLYTFTTNTDWTGRTRGGYQAEIAIVPGLLDSPPDNPNTEYCGYGYEPDPPDDECSDLNLTIRGTLLPARRGTARVSGDWCK